MTEDGHQGCVPRAGIGWWLRRALLGASVALGDPREEPPSVVLGFLASPQPRRRPFRVRGTTWWPCEKADASSGGQRWGPGVSVSETLPGEFVSLGRHSE